MFYVKYEETYMNIILSFVQNWYKRRKYSGTKYFSKRNVAIPLRSVPTEIETFLFGFRSTFPSHLLGDPVAAGKEKTFASLPIDWCTPIYKKIR